MSVLAVSDVKYAYQSRYRVVNVLNDVSCSFEMGKFLCHCGQVRQRKDHPAFPAGRPGSAGQRRYLL